MPDEPQPTISQRGEIKETLQTRLISEPLKSKIDQDLSQQVEAVPLPPANLYEVIIEVNLNYPGGRTSAHDTIMSMLKDILTAGGTGQEAIARNRPDSTHPYVFATLTAVQIFQLVNRDGDQARSNAEARNSTTQGQQPPTITHPPSVRTLRSIFRIWESQKIRPLTIESIRTVKANAAHNSFGAFGDDVVWAVLDSGVDATHPHFSLHHTLELNAPLNGRSCSFTAATLPWDQDAFGHGTHVAAIIAGESNPSTVPQAAIQSAADSGEDSYHLQPVPGIKGMAPHAKLLVLRVLDDNGDGDETALIQAIEYVQQLNDFGRHIVVHGINISAGFPAHSTWYACGQTPLCVEINRLVKSGVAVVVAAGNSGHIVTFLSQTSTTEAGQMLSINDPGNADLAITVGSTHRESPHIFGVSYFSSKGPTSDGRRKPEVVAPGEKIISAASAQRAAVTPLPGLNGAHFDYLEDTGTSMAAPHVSGVLAAFLSVKREYIGLPEKVRDLLVESAIDLGRDPHFQGAGLIDLMKLIQSV
ncbi:S8 family peptidase [Tunturiibacter psychrotolerans]|uniref:S8 family peptidase n=1 Tax=Tunturiibacter psychrotolerans TaxID=3069686 RepID=UPI003D229872